MLRRVEQWLSTINKVFSESKQGSFVSLQHHCCVEEEFVAPQHFWGVSTEVEYVTLQHLWACPLKTKLSPPPPRHLRAYRLKKNFFTLQCL